MTQKEVEPRHISYTIIVRGDVVFRFLDIGLNHFPSLVDAPPPPLISLKMEFFHFGPCYAKVGGFRPGNIKRICLLPQGRLGKGRASIASVVSW